MFYSTKHQSPPVTFREAVLRGLAPDGGLYFPVTIPRVPSGFLDRMVHLSFQELSFRLSQLWIGEEIPSGELWKIVEKAWNFDAPLKQLDEDLFVLELFHGPTLAFKDFGARYLAQILSYFLGSLDREVIVLVATSGDTGSAVAHGFFRVPGIRVVLLYPSGRVSEIQEKQFTTLGENVLAVEIKGNFDDCQRLVKQAFLDAELNERLYLTSANSMNIARLLPQSFYYFRALAQMPVDKPVLFSVPSGNFGNLTAGLMAQRMGLPVGGFIAATNINDVVPEYLTTGVFRPRPSIPTLSNAMDVGDPSNFARMQELYRNDLSAMRKDLTGFAVTDSETRETIRQVRRQYGYDLDPHGAVACYALQQILEKGPGIFLETAHPAKFRNDVEIPGRLQIWLSREKQAVPMDADFSELKDLLMSL